MEIKIRVWERTSQFRDDSLESSFVSTNGEHARWLYRQLRQDGLKPADARMNLCFAIKHGQSDMRRRVEQAVRA